ncbi:class I SAM-dependent methyltransferase [Saccharomonospora glauca]|uniref:Methyltransferase family protein n=1 Tax=Saccharomonospora glauca K62 TaxID=928724 RepID=I1D215_9PSEU|nr:class I SAM-dependent methyltransferase [Saccharomonospora glauca]EIE98989.1 methyltransferase family protein [Saccharomonospora glauca K62]
MYESTYVDVYDLVMRNRPKDYEKEAASVVEVIRERNGSARSLLDVACGTGLHLRYLADAFDSVEGVDLSPDMLALARKRIPRATFSQGDMRTLDRGAKFSAVTCLFAIPHLSSEKELKKTVRSLVDHLEPGGVVVVEPWFTPEQFLPGYIASDVVKDGDRVVHRLSHSVLVGPQEVKMTIHYAVAETDRGIRNVTRTVDMTLFTDAQYEEAFRDAGCAAEFLPLPAFTRGVWVAQR